MKKILLVAACLMLFSTTAFAFSDTDAKEINYLQSNGIVDGYEDGSFRPDEKINRAEFLKIVMEAAEFQGIEHDGEGADCFSDVRDEWFAQYVCGAFASGLVDGYEDGSFGPDRDINFVEASKILANALELDVDDKYIENWFEKYVVVLEDLGAIPRSILKFEQEITRGEMAEIIYRLLIGYNYSSATYADIRALTELGGEIEALDVGRFKVFYAVGDLVYAVEFGRSYLVPGADPSSFSVAKGFSRQLFVDDEDVFLIDVGGLLNNEILVLDFDGGSFEYVFGPFDYANNGDTLIAKDANGVYLTNRLSDFGMHYNLRGIDPDTVEVAYAYLYGPFILRDQDGYYLVRLDQDDIAIDLPVDEGTLELFHYGFYKDMTGVYSYLGEEFVEPVENVDVDSFEYFLEADYLPQVGIFADKSNIYYVSSVELVEFTDVDRETAEYVLLDDVYYSEILHLETDSRISQFYLRDKDGIWAFDYHDKSWFEIEVEGDLKDFDYSEWIFENGYFIARG